MIPYEIIVITIMFGSILIGSLIFFLWVYYLDSKRIHKQKESQEWLNWGNEYFLQKDFNQAIECYMKALEINSDNWTARERLKIAQEIPQKYQETIKSYNYSIKNDISDKDIWKNVGFHFLELNEYRKAIDCFKRVVKIDPQDKSALHCMVLVYNSLGEEENAKSYLEILNKFQHPQETLILDTLTKTLKAEPGIRHVVLSDRTGRVISHVSKISTYPFSKITYHPVKNVEEVAASTSAIFSASEEQGVSARIGSLKYVVSEYDFGKIFLRLCGSHSVIAMITEKDVSIGMIRLVMNSAFHVLNEAVKKLLLMRRVKNSP